LLENSPAYFWMFFKSSLVKASSTVIALYQPVFKEDSLFTWLIVHIVVLFATSFTNVLEQIFGPCSTLGSAYVCLYAGFCVDHQSVDTRIFISSLNSACDWPLRLLQLVS
jgi:hypothetical protein